MEWPQIIAYLFIGIHIVGGLVLHGYERKPYSIQNEWLNAFIWYLVLYSGGFFK